MRKIVALFIAILLLIVASPAPSFSKEKNKKHHFKLIRHRKRERMKLWATGHTAFKTRSKKDQKRIGRHHMTPANIEKQMKRKNIKDTDRDVDSDAGNKKGEDKENKQPDKENTALDKDAPGGNVPKEDAPKDTPPPPPPPDTK